MNKRTVLKQKLKLFATRHRPNGQPNVFLHSLPRSGSSWLMELILTQPGFASCNEPLNLRKEAVRDHLGLTDWTQLHGGEGREKIYEYLQGFCSGSLRDSRFNRPAPFSRFYRPITNRIVFKIVNAGEEHINWLSDSLNGRVLFLLRHPVPVSLSRKYFPKLDTILDTGFREFFTESQREFANRIISEDSKFARGILDWSLRNSVALQARTESWTIVTYEQLTLNPLPVVAYMAGRLNLPEPGRMIERLSAPSRSTELSSRGTQQVLSKNRDDSKQRWLVEKWQKEVTSDDLAVAQEILATFGLDRVYDVASSLPDNAYWIS